MLLRRSSAYASLFPLLVVAGLQAQQEANTLTYHNNMSRTGTNKAETTLTLANVNSKTFGKLDIFGTDGVVDAQPLYVAGLKIGGETRNVVFIATENDTVYANDAESGKVLWQRSLLNADETPSTAPGCSTAEIGAMATPVIDLSKGPNGAIYVVNAAHHTNGNYHQRLNALDLTTGDQLFGGPREITATYPGTGDNSSGGNVVFDPSQYSERAALLEWDGEIITTWASHCDQRPYTGWVISFDADSLMPKSTLNVTPNGNAGGIWMGAGGPAATASEVYFLDGNGSFDTALNSKGFPVNGDLGNAFLGLIDNNGKLQVQDYYATDDTVKQSSTDTDLGSGGVVILPTVYDNSGNAHELAVGAGKDMNIYVVNRTNMGKYHPDGGSIYQIVPGALSGGEYGTPVYFDSRIYFGGLEDNIRAFRISNAKVAATPEGKTGITFAYPGTTPVISSNGSSNGIVWALQHSGSAVLYAFDATNLSNEIYNSTQSGKSGDFGAISKFVTPMVANGRVYVPTNTGVAVFGLLGN